jgi:hypothetical protein
MPINTKESYIEIGTGVSGTNLLNTLQLPCPVELPSSNEFLVDAGRNADGTMLIEYVGRTQYTTQLKWARLKNTEWWKINRWFENYGYVFYMKYFSHTEGKVKIQRFYRGNIEKANPSSTTEVKNGITVPTHYYNCGFSIIDMGESDVITVSEVY